jgi:PAS domain S-box-containing protein
MPTGPLISEESHQRDEGASAEDVHCLIRELKIHQAELEESRNRYADLYDHAPIGYLILDENGLVLEINHTGADLLGGERDSLIKKPFSLYIAPEDRDEFHSHLGQTLGSKTRQTTEIKLVKEDGTEFHARLESIAVRDVEGNCGQLRTVVSDITERKLAEEELKESKRFHDTIFANMGEGLIVIDRDYIIHETNEAFARMHRIKREDIIGVKCFRKIHNRNRPCSPRICPVNTVFSEGKPEKRVHRHRDRTGKELFTEVTASPIKAPDESIRWAVVIHRDITRRKDSETKIVSLTRLNEDIIENSPVPTFTVSRDSRVISWNKAMEEFSGIKKPDAVEKDFRRLSLRLEDAGVFDDITKAINTGQKAEKKGMKIGPLPKGGSKYIDYWVSPLPGSKGAIISIKDVTIWNEMLETLRASEEKYRDLFENAPDMIHILDSEGFIKDCNKRELDILGYTKKELLGRHFTELLDEDSSKEFWEVFEAVKKDGHVANIERFVKAKDGTEIPVLVNATVSYNRDGSISSIRAILRDMRDIKKAQKQFETALDAIDAMGEGIIITDEDGRIDFINRAGEEILGISPVEYLKKPVGCICRGRTAADYFERVFKKILPERGRWKGEFACFNDGKKRYFQVNTMVLQGEEKDSLGTISIMRDVTAERERENRLIVRKSAYQFDFGRCYFTDSPGQAFKFFGDLTGHELEGVIVSRKLPEDFEALFGTRHHSFWLAKSKGRDTIHPEPEIIRDQIEQLLDSNPVILFDGLEYLVTQNGFDRVLELIQDLNELLYVKRQGVLLFSIDPKAFRPAQFRLLARELKKLKKKERNIDKKLLEVMEYLYDMESEGLRPCYADVQKAIRVSKVTASRRIGSLKIRGFIWVKKIGRTKYIELTQKGRDFFEI